MEINRAAKVTQKKSTFGIKFSTVLDNEFNGLPTTPSFLAAKEHNSVWPDRDLSHPAEEEYIHYGGAGTNIISGYLYSGGRNGKELFYSHGNLDRLEKIAEWGDLPGHPDEYNAIITRSEERRVGKECGYRWRRAESRNKVSMEEEV